mgnify:FL=1
MVISLRFVLVLMVLLAPRWATASSVPGASMSLQAIAKEAMVATGARGLAIAVVEDGEVAEVGAWGDRNQRGEPLDVDTVMYGASLTKAVVGYYAMQLVDAGRLDLDRPLAEYLPKPLPDYGNVEDRADWSPLADDPRWAEVTARHVLTHSVGFANFGFLEPDGRLRFHFDPGARYAYSGDGFILLQFVLEAGLGIDFGESIQQRVFTPLGMGRTSLQWRQDFAPNVADGWTLDGSVEPHDERSTPRAAGSMDTTIADMARFAAAYIRGDRLMPASQRAVVTPHLGITTRSQFPSLQPELPVAMRTANLSAGLGVVVFNGPRGRGFFKGGHNDSTGNTWVCVIEARDCVVILANDVRAEAAFPAIVASVLGETGVPWRWEYGDMRFWNVGEGSALATP